MSTPPVWLPTISTGPLRGTRSIPRITGRYHAITSNPDSRQQLAHEVGVAVVEVTGAKARGERRQAAGQGRVAAVMASAG